MNPLRHRFLPAIVFLALFGSRTLWAALAAPITYDAKFIHENWDWSGVSTRGLIMHNGVQVLQVVTTNFETYSSSFQTPYLEYVATFRFKLFSAEAQDYSAGFGFSGIPDGFPRLHRNHSVYVVPGKVGLFSLEQPYVKGPASSLYTFDFVDVSMSIRRAEASASTELAVYANATIGSILDGSAPPLFTRTATTPAPNGVLRFGDNSGEQHVNSYYLLESVIVQGVTIPEPGGAGLLVMGGIAVVSLRKRKRCVLN